MTFGGYLYTPNYLKNIDHMKCQNCERCLELCETRGIDENGNIIPEFPEICSGCGHCGNVCPAQSIEAEPVPLKEMVERVRRKKNSR